MNLTLIYEQLINGKHLSTSDMTDVMHACMNGTLSDAQIAAFLVLMRMKGETINELKTAAFVMKQFATSIELGDDLVDIVGTGGDGKHTFNVSTISSFVASACGVRMAKHGNHATSSKSGSADLLLEAGFNIELPEAMLKRCLNECGIVFLFGPHFHPAMKYARTARKELGLRTMFNLLGPLLNPANVKQHIVGVYDKQWLKPVAQVLASLNSEHALVIHSQDHLDEISVCAPTDIIEYKNKTFKSWSLNPKDYGCAHSNLDEIIVKTPAQSLALAHSVLTGKKGVARDMILLNSAAAIYCAQPNVSFGDAIRQAADAIDNGQAYERFNQLKQLTRSDLSYE